MPRFAEKKVSRFIAYRALEVRIRPGAAHWHRRLKAWIVTRCNELAAMICW
jgi:hypothetical protein